MTDLAEAARATRRYIPGIYNTWNPLCIFDTISRKTLADEFNCSDEAQAACDLKNLEEVLRRLREPSEGMCTAGVHRARRDQIPAHVLATNWRAMIDAAIAEVRSEVVVRMTGRYTR